MPLEALSKSSVVYYGIPERETSLSTNVRTREQRYASPEGWDGRYVAAFKLLGGVSTVSRFDYCQTPGIK